MTTPVDPAPPFRLADIVRRPDPDRRAAVALVEADRRLTYADLDARSDAVAGALQAAGIGVGDRVLLLDTNSIEFFELLFAAAKIGAVLVPLNTRLVAAELTVVALDSTARLLVAGTAFADVAAQVVAAVAAAGGSAPPQLLVVGADYERWLLAQPPITTDQVRVADDPVLQLYTSGTTGVPKGVQLSHRNFDALRQASENWSMGLDTVSMVAMPLFHIGGAGWALAALQAGARNILVPALDPVPVLDLMEHERVSHCFLVPAALAILCAVPGSAERDWSALRAVIYGASPITTDVLLRVLGTFRAPVFQVYGMTETTGAITQLDPADHDPGGPREHLMRSAGRPYPWVALRVVDPVSGADRPAGEVGELLVRSPQVTRGYWNRPVETARALDAEGWMHTGDAGYLDEAGYLFLTDRIKDMIVSGGENIYPIEVENVLAAHPAVVDVAVIGIPDERYGETVKAFVVLAPGHALEQDEIVEWTRGKLAGFKRPRSVEVIAALPRNPTGKVLKKDLRAPFWAGRERGIG